MLGGLRLRAGLVAGDEQENGVHDGGTVQHCGHENVVAWTVDERNVPEELEFATAVGPFAWELVVFVAAC